MSRLGMTVPVANETMAGLWPFLDELAAAGEQVGKPDASGRTLEQIVLVHLEPGHPPARRRPPYLR